MAPVVTCILPVWYTHTPTEYIFFRLGSVSVKVSIGVTVLQETLEMHGWDENGYKWIRLQFCQIFSMV